MITQTDLDDAVDAYQTLERNTMVIGGTLWNEMHKVREAFNLQKKQRKPLLISEGPYYDKDIYGLYMVPPSVDLERGLERFCQLYNYPLEPASVYSDYDEELDNEIRDITEEVREDALGNMIENGLIEKREGYAERDIFRAYLAWLCREDVIERREYDEYNRL